MIYGFVCETCGAHAERYFRMHETKAVMCDCGAVMRRDWRGEYTPQVPPEFFEHINTNMGHAPVRISGRRQFREELKARGLVQVPKHPRHTEPSPRPGYRSKYVQGGV